MFKRRDDKNELIKKEENTTDFTLEKIANEFDKNSPAIVPLTVIEDKKSTNLEGSMIYYTPCVELDAARFIPYTMMDIRKDLEKTSPASPFTHKPENLNRYYQCDYDLVYHNICNFIVGELSLILSTAFNRYYPVIALQLPINQNIYNILYTAIIKRSYNNKLDNYDGKISLACSDYLYILLNKLYGSDTEYHYVSASLLSTIYIIIYNEIQNICYLNTIHLTDFEKIKSTLDCMHKIHPEIDCDKGPDELTKAMYYMSADLTNIACSQTDLIFNTIERAITACSSIDKNYFKPDAPDVKYIDYDDHVVD